MKKKRRTTLYAFGLVVLVGLAPPPDQQPAQATRALPLLSFSLANRPRIIESPLGGTHWSAAFTTFNRGGTGHYSRIKSWAA